MSNLYIEPKIEFNESGHYIRIGKDAIKLSPVHFNILKTLIESKGKSVPVNALGAFTTTYASLMSHVSSLRAKMRPYRFIIKFVNKNSYTIFFDGESKIINSRARDKVPVEIVAKMIDLRRSGMGIDDIAKETGFSRYFVERFCGEKSAKEAKPAEKANTKIRKCLMCRQKFGSTWAGERVCQTCKGTQDWKSGGGLI